MSADRRCPYTPKQVILQEHTMRPELYNEHNNRLERVIGEMKEIVMDVVAMKNIVLGEVQKWAEVNDKNNYSMHCRADEIMSRINASNNEVMSRMEQLEAKQTAEFSAIQKILIEIKERLAEYEVDPDFDELPTDSDEQST